MMNVNPIILNILASTEQKNDLTSPLLVFKSEKIAHQGKYYLKTYVYQTEDMIKQLNEIRFKVKFITELVIVAFEFKKVESIDDANAFGCLIELPFEYAQKEFSNDFSISICGYIIDNKVIEIPESKLEQLLLLKTDALEKRTEFLKEKSTSYVMDPFFTRNYWMCTCGKMNSNEAANCKNCGQDESLIKSVLYTNDSEYSDLVFTNEFIESRAKNAVFDLTKDFETNYSLILGNLEFIYGVKPSQGKSVEMKEKFKTLFDSESLLSIENKRLKKKRRKVSIIVVPIVCIFLIVSVFLLSDYSNKAKVAAELARKTEILKYWNKSWISKTWEGEIITINIDSKGSALLKRYYSDSDSTFNNTCTFNFIDETMACRFGSNDYENIYERTATGLKSWNPGNHRNEIYVRKY